MSVEKNFAENLNSDAVQFNAELPQGEQETSNEPDSGKPSEIDTPPSREVEQASKVSKDEPTATSNQEATTEKGVDSTVETKEETEVKEDFTPDHTSTNDSDTNESDQNKNSDDRSGDDQMDVTSEKDGEIEEHIDYSSLGKDELLEHIAEIAQNFRIKKSGGPANQIKDAFNLIIDQEEAEALKKFLGDGGVKEDFAYSSESKIKFDEYYKIIREKRQNHFKSLEKEKEQNLKIKNELLDKLRNIVDNEESSSINELKKLQEEWKAVGPVLPQHNKTLWANYHALLDRFYDHRSIYFELKDLDRKKNLESKLELCNKAEELSKEENLNNAIKALNELHDEFKHIGPVPREEQENLWIRFKTASDVIYSKRKEYTHELLAQLKENLSKKLEVIAELENHLSFSSDKISEWNAKTKEVQELQKKWESIGGMPKENAKKVNKQFWGNFKKFYHNKSAFFKTLESQREANLEIKLGLLEKAEQLAGSQEWDKTSNELIKLQNQWRDTGPVPEKHRNEIYKKFKTACDTFFTQKRTHNKEINSEYSANLTKKEDICGQLEALAQESNTDTDKIYELQDAFNSVGFVPRKSIKKIQNRYNQAIHNLMDSAKDLDKDDLESFKTTLTINDVRSGPNADQKIQRQEYTLRRKISNLENDVSTWKNNMAFFNNSENAKDLLKDFEQKIENSEKEIVKLKAELRVLQSV